MLNKKLLFLLLIILILFCCIFQCNYSYFYKNSSNNIEAYDNMNPTSLGNYQIPAKYIVLDFSRNTGDNTLNNFSLYILSNGNTEKVDLKSIATVNIIDKNLEDIVNNENKLSLLNEDEETNNLSDLLTDNNTTPIKISNDEKKNYVNIS